MLSVLFVAAASLSAAPGVPAGAQESEAFAISAKKVLVDGKTVVEDGVVIIERGKVREVLDAKHRSKADGLPRVDHDGWVSAGMVAARSYLGTRGELSEPKRVLTPQARMVDVVDFDHPEFQDALRAGVTTVVIAPSAANLIGGQSAVVKTVGRQIVDADAHLLLAPSASALRLNRAPTSYAGAMAMLAREFEKPQGALADAVAGKLPVLIEVDGRDEIARALEFAAAHKLRGALSHAPLAGELAAEVKSSGLAAVVGPFGAGTGPRVLDSVLALAKESVPLAFGLDYGSSAHELRWSAVMCVRQGLAADHAWNALTSHAAAILGLQERVGTLRAGCDADVVLWSGPPLELTSRVQGVFVGGVHVWGGDQ
jgi:imidazolonepropionase-like amidohydrolase